MELYLDTADVASIAKLVAYLPLQGVTTNPSILAAAGRKPSEILPEIRELIGAQGKLFAQVMAMDADGMVRDAQILRSFVSDIVVKVPVTREGVKAIKMLKQEGIETLGTAVYCPAQGLLAALAGAAYIAPYVNRLDAQGGDGIKSVQELQALLGLHAPNAKVLAASFKNTRQVSDCLLAGCESVTLPVDVADQILSVPAVDAAVEKFNEDWRTAFGGLGIN